MAFEADGPAEAWPVELRGDTGGRARGRIVRTRDELLIIAIGVGQSRCWKTGDAVDVVHTRAAEFAAPKHGRVYSVYRTIAADHVVIDVSPGATLVRDTTDGTKTLDEDDGGEQRASARVRPDSARPILALLTVGKATIEGRPRTISADGMGLYVTGRGARPLETGSLGTLVFALPDAASNCRFVAKVVRQEPMVHGVLYGLQIQPDADAMSQHHRELLKYVGSRLNDVRGFGLPDARGR